MNPSGEIPMIPDSVHRMWPELDGLGFGVKSSHLGGYVQISQPRNARESSEKTASRSAMKSAAPNPRDLEESSRRKIPVITDSSRQMFAELEGIEIRMRSSSHDWADERMSELPHVDIQRYHELDVCQRMKVLCAGIESLYRQVTTQSVGYLLMAAWGLVSSQNKQVYVFPKVAMSGPCVDVTELEQRALVTLEGTGLPFARLWSPQQRNAFERTAAYMCAATLRLITKDEGSLHRAWKSIMRNYSNFYHEEPAFELTPNLDCLEAIRNFLQARRHLKGTIACFLLGFLQLEGQDRRLCSTLFERDMAYTGMHAYTLLMSVTEMLQAPLSEVIKVVTHPSLVDALRTIVHIVLKYELPQTDADRERAMGARTWKYARIFDSAQFAAIQTKNCEMLVAVLATIAQKLGGGGDATKIHGISGYLTTRRDVYEKRADVFISYFKSGTW
ncbi:hypothetical protein DM860_003739 [Cuscuta australis]|uniref:Uncharacterized protein n=1 Tax=Cuscuta australis TaxID=267555 RepID=A0A328DIF3_9ASTE|nr:hypothetical protein DM860_003739 [Cuscuta australis]